MAKPFVLSSDWIYYAHGPGAEDGQPLAVELVDLMGKKFARIPADRPDLVREIISQAECFAEARGGDDEDKAYARKARRVIERAQTWLQADTHG